MTTDQSAPKRRWTTWVLIASLAVNLIVIGAVVGSHLRGGDARRGGQGVVNFLRAMPDSQRDILRTAMTARRETVRALRAEIIDLRRQFVDVVGADPLDTVRLEALMEAHRRIEDKIARGGQAILLERVMAMSAEERARFVSNIRDQEARRHRRK